MTSRNRIVVPCFNEAKRLRLADFMSIASHSQTSLIFVDDGSTDDTFALLSSLKAQSDGTIDVLRLQRNWGKGEAVRAGLNFALGDGTPPDFVGYIDADLSTPASEVLRLLDDMQTRPARVILGSRVRLLGTNIHRRAVRHYFGRVFATAASLVLGIGVYDTQCGMKLFRVNDSLRDALGQPFASRWIFDVELLGRLLKGATPGSGIPLTDIVEMPLREWPDVAGSRMSFMRMMSAPFDLARIAYRLHRLNE